MDQKICIVECPRDAMQGITQWINTDDKIRYINRLLKTGFPVLDFGSFVSPKAIPQMRDTAEVLKGLELAGSVSDLLVIVANERGAREAAAKPEIRYLGFPFSISETFQLKNTNSTIEESVQRVQRIREIAGEAGQELVVYLSMAFGNPYGDPWHPEAAAEWIGRLAGMGIKTIALADTVGLADPDTIFRMTSAAVEGFPDVRIGVHLHTSPLNWKEKVEAAWEAGCQRFDTAIAGFGGCPMAQDELVGNLPTENLLAFLEKKGIDPGLNLVAFEEARVLAMQIMG